MQRRDIACATSALLTLLMIAGCGSEQVGVTRVQTVPVTGKVLIDGSPVENVAIRALRADGEKSAAIVSSTAYTAQDGSFEISTYERGDGVPPGEYKLTFQWGRYNLFNGQYTGDRFEGKYSDLETSEFPVSVVSDSIDMGTIELTTD